MFVIGVIIILPPVGIESSDQDFVDRSRRRGNRRHLDLPRLGENRHGGSQRAAYGKWLIIIENVAFFD